MNKKGLKMPGKIKIIPVEVNVGEDKPSDLVEKVVEMIDIGRGFVGNLDNEKHAIARAIIHLIAQAEREKLYHPPIVIKEDIPSDVLARIMLKVREYYQAVFDDAQGRGMCG